MQDSQTEKNQRKNCAKLTNNHERILHLQDVHIFAIKTNRVNQNYILLTKNLYFEGKRK